MSEIIKAEHLRYVYNPGMPDETAALDDVSFSIEQGDFVGVMGSTGSGKSTLIAHFNGLNRPTSGKLYVDGRDMWAEGQNLRDFRFLVGLVMQYPEYQLFEETCWKDIAYGPRNMGLDEAEITRRVREAADFVGLSDELLQKSPFELSGGQQRRVAFAGVLAMEPEVLVLDEPMAGLDPAARRDFLELIDRLHREGLTVVMVSHSMDDLAKCCDRIVVMNEGAVFADGTPAQVFAHANELKSIGLGVPAAQRMALSLVQAGVPLRCDKLYTVESLADELAGMLLGCADGPLRASRQAGSKMATQEEGS